MNVSENSNNPGVVLTGAKQTMSSWTKRIESYEDVPSIYKDFFETPGADDRPFPYTLLTPSLAKRQDKTTEKLIYDADGAIHILERRDDWVVKTSYPYQTVCATTMGIVLLSSRLTIRGITSEGEAGFSTIDFNTASARHFTIFLNKLRPTPRDADEAHFRTEKDKFNSLSKLNYKLMNYGRSSLIHGETVRQILLQPEIKRPVWARLGNLFLKTVSPARLVVLTDQELILIQDIGNDRKTRQPQYGGVWQYIPLRSIKSAAWSEAENIGAILSIAVSPHETIETLFAVPNKPEVERLCAQLQEAIGVAK